MGHDDDDDSSCKHCRISLDSKANLKDNLNFYDSLFKGIGRDERTITKFLYQIFSVPVPSSD
ncbi:hypothetical protein HanLR1_Chr01g0015491 [Helianthus annuus]|nr:hypothetical protein HanLR1_Chr01g0015491 [Helianthus annuus]